MSKAYADFCLLRPRSSRNPLKYKDCYGVAAREEGVSDGKGQLVNECGSNYHGMEIRSASKGARKGKLHPSFECEAATKRVLDANGREVHSAGQRRRQMMALGLIGRRGDSAAVSFWRADSCAGFRFFLRGGLLG